MNFGIIFAAHNTVDVVQLVRMSDCGSEGRGFESHLPPPGLVIEVPSTRGGDGNPFIIKISGIECKPGYQ
jgi:hypothetical protein